MLGITTCSTFDRENSFGTIASDRFSTELDFLETIYSTTSCCAIKMQLCFFFCAACVRSSISSTLNDNGFRFSAFFLVFAPPSNRLKQKRVSVRRWRCHLRTNEEGLRQHRKEVEWDKSNETTERERENKQQGKESVSERRPEPPCMQCEMKQEEDEKKNQPFHRWISCNAGWESSDWLSVVRSRTLPHTQSTRNTHAGSSLCVFISSPWIFFRSHFSVNFNGISLSSVGLNSKEKKTSQHKKRKKKPNEDCNFRRMNKWADVCECEWPLVTWAVDLRKTQTPFLEYCDYYYGL